jgi:hypothetical protein
MQLTQHLYSVKCYRMKFTQLSASFSFLYSNVYTKLYSSEKSNQSYCRLSLVKKTVSTNYTRCILFALHVLRLLLGSNFVHETIESKYHYFAPDIKYVVGLDFSINRGTTVVFFCLDYGKSLFYTSVCFCFS